MKAEKSLARYAISSTVFLSLSWHGKIRLAINSLNWKDSVCTRKYVLSCESQQDFSHFHLLMPLSALDVVA